MRRKVIAVVGSAECPSGSSEWEQAYDLGKCLVDQGYRVLTGGQGGVMEAAMAGARASSAYREGDTVAIFPTFCPEEANPYADIVIATGADLYINGMVANADAIIAIGGGAGTLSEITMALELGRPVLSYGNVVGSSQLIIEFRSGMEGLYEVKSAAEVAATLPKILA